jgi:hypothetical protein
MEDHRPKKLLDQVHACPEPGEGMPSASNTLPNGGKIRLTKRSDCGMISPLGGVV